MILYMSNHIRRQDGFLVHIQDGASSFTEAYRFLSVSRGEAVQSCFIQVKYKNTVDKTEHQLSRDEFLRRVAPAHTVCHEPGVEDFLSRVFNLRWAQACGTCSFVVMPQLNHTNLDTEAKHIFLSPSILKSNKAIPGHPTPWVTYILKYMIINLAILKHFGKVSQISHHCSCTQPKIPWASRRSFLTFPPKYSNYI